MRLVVSVEHRFAQAPSGEVLTQAGFDYAIWTRYLDVFDEVRVVARVRPLDAVRGDFSRADGPRVSFSSVPFYLGPWQYLCRAGAIRRASREALRPSDAVILRVASPIGNLLERVLRRWRHPYGLEVVGDPYETFAPGAVEHPLRPLFRWWFSRKLRRQCRRAAAVAYVTERALQRRYPSGPEALTTSYSSVSLQADAYARTPRIPRREGPITAITIGSLEQMYKGPDTLLRAVARCRLEGLDLRLVLVGDGRHRPELESMALGLGIVTQVRFAGQLVGGDAVRRELDRAHLFVLPSRTEGLPRAMIEAMARALPCIGSTAGGIPELLPGEDTVPPGDPAVLASRIREVVTDPARMARMSARNLAKSHDYREEALRERRVGFYRHLRSVTEEWLRERRAR